MKNGKKMTEALSMDIMMTLLRDRDIIVTRTTDKYCNYDLENVERDMRVEVKCRTISHQQVLFYNSAGLMMEHTKYQSLSGHKSLFVNIFDTDKGVFIVCWDVKQINSLNKYTMMCAKSGWDYNNKVPKEFYKLNMMDTNYIFNWDEDTNVYTKITYDQFVEFGNDFKL